ncbi:MAG: InlB B-repeat-containing protein, partial [Clostridia bacterium]|nr:InlB B-repeat-containing protein [Clostridia bacterium]
MKKIRLWAIVLVMAFTAVVSAMIGTGCSKKDFEVTFALPDTATEAERQITTLPEKITVPSGTTIGSLETASRLSSTFLTWSYDAAGNERAAETDVIDRDLTLYPVFALMDGMGDAKGFDYVSKTDVGTDYVIELISYGLTEEEIRERLTVENASFGGEPVEFTLLSIRLKEAKEWLLSDGFDDETAEKILTYIREKDADKTVKLRERLSTLAEDPALSGQLTYAKVTDIVSRYAPQELESNEFVNDPSIDEGLKSVLAAMGIDLATATADEVREYFGLPEDDSLERYFREDVGLSVEQVLALEEILYKKKEVRVDKWQLIPEGGEWEGGLIYSVIASDTAKLRYIYDEEPTGKEVVKYNITVHQETVENISIDPRVIHVPASEVSGVEYLGLLSLDMDEDGQIQADENSGSGALTYTGTEVFRANDILAINQGDVDEKGLTNGDVAYVRITGVMCDGIYSYEYAQLTDVLFIADTIPVKDDGSMDDGKITIDLSAYDFSDPKYLEFGLDETTGLDVGDYLAFYTGTFGGEDFAVKGHGIITAVTKAGDIANVTYDLKTEEEILEPELLLYTKLPEMEFEITEPDNEKLRQEMEQQIADSGLVGETQEFFKALLTDGSLDFDAYEHGDELRSMIIKTDGEDMTLADLRKLADGGKVEVSDVHVTFLAGINLQHFEGKKGLRGEAAVWFTINIAIGDAGSLEIQPAIIFEQEFLLTPSVKVKRNKNKAGLTSSLDITASFEAGTYSGLGVTVTAKTKAPENANKDKDFSEMVGGFIDNGDKDSLEARQKAAKMLIKGGDFLQKQADKQKKKGQGQGFDATPGNNNDPKTGSDSKQDYVSPGLGGDLPTKYSSMLSNDAKYINLVNVDLGSFDLPIDPAGIIHVGLKINFNIGMKINAMIGAGITYENAKCYSYHFRAKIWGGGDEYKTKNLSGENYSSVTDIKESTFRADFYAFGMVGVRMGVSLDLRVGIFSTDLDSVGVVASAGVYAELYGFLYVYYEKVASLPAKSGASGSLLFEVGIYADISVKVQVGAGKASKSWSLYSLKTPLVQLGCTEFPLDFLIKPNDSKLSVKIKDGENTVKLDDSIFKMKLMALNSGKVSDKNMDSKVVSESDGTRYTAELVTSGQTEDTKGLVLSTKRSWTQCNEEHFTVECFDLTKENGERIKGASSFQYLPGTNEIYICPIDNTKSDVWGEVVFTYRNNAFGFNTEKLQRTVKVHWHGTKRVAKVEYYLQDNSQRDSIYSFKLDATGKVSGYDGVRCYVEVTPEFCDMYPGYTLHYLGYPDEEELKAKYDEISERYHKERNHANYLAKVALEARVGDTSDKEKDAAAAEAYKQANNTFDTLQFISSLYKEYYDNNMAAVWNRQGTTYFTLRGTETVVAVYFRKQDTPTCWTVFNDDGTWVTSTSYYRQADGTYTDQYWKQALLKDIKTLDQMPTLMEGIDEGHYTVKWYSFEFDTSGGVWRDIAGDQKWVIEGLIRDNKYLTDSRVKPVDENTVYNGNWMTIFAVRTPDTCKAHWMVDEDEFKVTEVPYGRLVTAPSEIPVKEGFEFVEWTTEDGLAITSDLTMTDDDIYLYASFLGDAHTVKWITDDGKEAESEALTGVSVYGAVPEELRLDDKLYIWRTDKDDKSTELPYLSEMPNKDMTYYGRLAVGFSKITWIDGEEEIRSDYVEVGTSPTAPELAAKDDLDLVWMIDGEVMQTNFVMSRTDVKAIANRHKHVWDDAKEVTIEATCSASGLKGPACSVCGYIKDGVEIPADPNNHKWLNYVAEKPTCAKEGTTKQHCAWCVAINPNFSQPIEKDPEEHVGGTELRNYVKPTCQEGYSGDTYCLGCGVMLEEGHKLDPTGEHPSVHLVGEKDPTCLEPGYTGDWICDVCNQIA